MLLLALLLALPAAAAPRAVPDFQIPTLINAPLTKLENISELRGKIVYLKFCETRGAYAGKSSWPAACVGSILSLNRLAEAMKEEPVVFLMVTARPAGDIRKFMERHRRHPMNAWFGIDPARRLAEKLGADGGLPEESFIIGKDGTLLKQSTDIEEQDLRDALAGTLAPGPTWLPGDPVRDSPDSGPFPPTAAFELSFSSAHGAEVMQGGDKWIWGDSTPTRLMLWMLWGVDQQRIVDDAGLPAALNYSLKAPNADFEANRELLKSAFQSAYEVRVLVEKRETDSFLLALSTEPGAPRPLPGIEFEWEQRGGDSLVGTDDMPSVADTLGRALAKPVFDQTGLPGIYEFDLRWKKGDQADLERVLKGQGLRLVPARRSVEFLHIVPKRSI